jgi:hypothetical protein
MRGHGYRWWLSLVVAVCACGGEQEPAGEGADCYRDADCKPGLVCVPAGDARQCSSDTTGLESTVEAPPMPEPPTEPPPEGTGGTM